jgi:hypothetical protein
MQACVVNEHILNMLLKGVFCNWQYTLINSLQGFIRLIKRTLKLIENYRFFKDYKFGSCYYFFEIILFIECIVLQKNYQRY